MENTAADYQKLYEQSLLTIAQQREQAQLTISRKDEELEEHKAQLTLKDQKIELLSFELEKFRKYLFGRKSEKLSAQTVPASQLDLFHLGTTEAQQEALSVEAAQVEEVPQKKERKKRAKEQGRMVLPENLRREEIIINPTENVAGYVKIGEEVTEVLELIPAELYVKRYIRPKYARPNGEGVVIGELPERVVAKGIPSNSLVAQIIVNKYVYGLPLHRQIDQFRRMGVNIPASTISDWPMKGWRHLVPLWELLKLLVLAQRYLQVDESPFKVLDRDHKSGIHQGYMWVYHAPADRLVFFDYQKGRDQKGPAQMLMDYEGILQTDGYTVYEHLFADHPHIALIHCMAHARRKFVEAMSYDRQKASQMVAMMGKLYVLEQSMRDQNLSWEERTQIRQAQAVPQLNEIKAWLDKHLLTELPKSPLGQAISYTHSRWAGLSAYASHGQVEIDNNWVENAIRPLAIGRKNYLFAGSHQAAEMTAAMYSFMASCKKNDVNEVEWLKDVFDRIQSIKHKDLYQLLPNNWQKFRN